MSHNQYTSTPFLYGDGFLTRMFGRRDAALFIELLLKIDARNVHLVGNVPGWHNAMMTKIPSTQDARVDALGPNNQPLYLLDFIPPPIYHVVPQKIWTPPNQSNWRRYVEQASLHMPVFFIQNDGTIGLPLERALRGDSASLRLAGVPPPLGGAWGRGYSTRIRITWPGYEISYYESWDSQIQIRDLTRQRNEITLEQLANLFAGTVDRFLFAEGAVGLGGITRNNVIIIGAVHISAGEWMPILAICNPPAHSGKLQPLAPGPGAASVPR